jgi:hypothetical protein
MVVYLHMHSVSLLVLKFCGFAVKLLLNHIFLHWGHRTMYHGWRNDSIQGFPSCAYCCISLQPPLIKVSKPKERAASVGYHLLITTKICVNRLVRWLEENTRKYSGGRSLTIKGVGKEGVYTSNKELFTWPEYTYWCSSVHARPYSVECLYGLMCFAVHRFSWSVNNT